MAQLNMTDAAKTAGISRNTLYKKIKKGVISVTYDRQQNRVIDTSELVRVFGELQGMTGDDSNGLRYPQHQVTSEEDTVNTGGDTTDKRVLEELKARVTDLQATIQRMQLEAEQSREREQRLLGLLETRLLTDQRKKSSKKKQKSEKSRKKKAGKRKK